MNHDYSLLQTEVSAGVMQVSINNPPVNVMTAELFLQLDSLTEAVAGDESVRVVVFDSANPEFFIAHYDLEGILAFDISGQPERRDKPGRFHLMCERLGSMPQVTIARIRGRAGGGGAEFAAACDLRFGVLGKTLVNQMEVALGILPGGGGTQRLTRLIGPGRALEVMLGCADLDAETAESWGYLNRALDEAAIVPFVDRLAARMASFPRKAVALTKESVRNALSMPLAEGLREEEYLFQVLLRTREAGRNMTNALALGAQTREGELGIADLVLEAARQTRE